MLYFNRENQEQIYLSNLPKGRMYKQASVQGTNFNKFVKWIAKGFEWLIDKYNETFKGLFVCESRFFIEQFKKDYSIPNETFYQTTDKEHQIDIKVLKYLMQGNKNFHFKQIAQMYGYCVKVSSGVEYFKNSRIPNTIPHKLYSDFGNVNNILVITFYEQETDLLPHSVPHKLGSGLKIEKIKKIYDIIKPAQVKILYLAGDFDIEVTTEQEQCEQTEICVKGL